MNGVSIFMKQDPLGQPGQQSGFLMLFTGSSSVRDKQKQSQGNAGLVFPSRYDRTMVPSMLFPDMEKKNEEAQYGLQNPPGTRPYAIEDGSHI